MRASKHAAEFSSDSKDLDRRCDIVSSTASQVDECGLRLSFTSDPILAIVLEGLARLSSNAPDRDGRIS